MTQLDFDSLLQEKSYYSVSDLTREIKHLLEYQFPDVWVQGEISNFTHHNSGHMYFLLKDEEAQISCVMWRSQNYRLRFTPEDGLKISVNARVALYEKRGIYQLDVIQMQPAGIGELQLAFEQLKLRLQEEGLFDPAHKQTLPVFPQRIGIISSPTGAAISDLVSVMNRRFPAVDSILYPVRVQGEGSAQEIAAALDRFNEYGDVDILILARGGGSLEDLWAFNEEIVARAIFRSHLPVVSAVGHEIDFTISDFVADLRAPTPSAAAEMVLPDRHVLLSTIHRLRDDLTDTLLNRIRYQRDKLAALSRTYAFRQPLDLVHQNSQRLDETLRRMQAGLSFSIKTRKSALENLQNQLHLLSHQNVLQRGYTLCRNGDSGAIVKRAAGLQPADHVDVQFYDGLARVSVDDVSHDENERG